MQFITISRRLVDAFPPEAFSPERIAQEGQRVKELYASGILRHIWKRGDIPGAVILWEAASEAEVRAAIATLPLFKLELIETLLLAPLEPYPGFTS
jgi:muconolactone delta-isomerase